MSTPAAACRPTTSATAPGSAASMASWESGPASKRRCRASGRGSAPAWDTRIRSVLAGMDLCPSVFASRRGRAASGNVPRRAGNRPVAGPGSSRDDVSDLPGADDQALDGQALGVPREGRVPPTLPLYLLLAGVGADLDREPGLAVDLDGEGERLLRRQLRAGFR